MTHVTELAEALGLHGQNHPVGALQIVAAISLGLPVASLETVAGFVTSDASFKYRIVSKASLGRRRQSSLLSPQESDRVARVARIWIFAKEVWTTDEEARGFLCRPHPLLEDRCPIDLVVENEMGAELVRDVLGRLQVGSAA